MSKKLIVITDSKECSKKILELQNEMNFTCKVEVQIGEKIENRINESEINKEDLVLFAINKPVESIEEIERFIDFEYFEVEPKYIVDNPKGILEEIFE